MTALLALVGPKLIAILAAVVAALAWGFKQRLAGAKAERAKQAASEAKARDISNEIQNDVGALPGSKAREELSKWSKS